MFRPTLPISIFLVAALRSAVCTLVSRALPVFETGPFGPSLPASTKYVSYAIMGPSFSLAMDKLDLLITSYDECKANASLRGVPAWYHDSTSDICLYASVTHPVCRSYQGTLNGSFILEEYVSDGSPSDNAVLDPVKISNLLDQEPQLSFRVESPTILQIDGFTMPMEYPWKSYEQKNKFVIFPNDGTVVSTHDRILVDPACHTNSSCGVPFMTTSVALDSLPYVVMGDICRRRTNIRKGKGINVFSHAGIGCQFFPDPFQGPPCTMNIKGSGALVINVTLVNFQKRNCDGFKLRFLIFHSNGTRTPHSVCKENAPTEFVATAGRAKIDFYGSPTQTYQKYGFIINVISVEHAGDLLNFIDQ